MTPTLLATSFTPDYERGPRYVETLKRHCQLPFHVLNIGTDCPDYGMPRAILQAGHFLEHLPACERIVFTDADILLHRPLDDDEMDFLSSIKDGQIGACPNKHPDQRWAEEVPLLAPVIQLYGYEDVRVFNTGFVVCTAETYRALFWSFQKLWPVFNAAFQHYAKIQLAMCAAAREFDIEWVPVPGHLCSHGHCGLPPGVDLSTNPPTHHRRVVAFDHRLTH